MIRWREFMRSWMKVLLTGAVMVSILCLLGTVGAAQEAVRKGPPSTFFDYWHLAGPTKWALTGSAIWITSLVIELLFRVRSSVFCPPDIVQSLQSALAVKDYQKAWRICMDNASPLSRIMASGFERLNRGLAIVKEALMDAANVEFDKFKVKNSYLNLNATVGTLLGLFGTISGMIGAFNRMAYGGATGDPTKLAGDIGEALIVTWTGLGIAITTFYLFYIMTNRLKGVMSVTQQMIANLLNYIDFDEITPDMTIISPEMRAEYESGGKKGAVRSSSPNRGVKSSAAPHPTPAAKAGEEMAECPQCHQAIAVGTKKCPKCGTEMEWE